MKVEFFVYCHHIVNKHKMGKKKLVIVESVGKIKKLRSCLGSKYKVIASLGHISDLGKDCLGIDVSDRFKMNPPIIKNWKFKNAQPHSLYISEAGLYSLIMRSKMITQNVNMLQSPLITSTMESSAGAKYWEIINPSTNTKHQMARKG